MHLKDRNIEVEYDTVIMRLFRSIERDREKNQKKKPQKTHKRGSANGGSGYWITFELKNSRPNE